MHGQHDDLGVGQRVLDLAARLDAVHTRHGHVHEDHVGSLGGGARDRLVAVRGLTDDVESDLAHRPPEPLAEHLVVVHDHQANGHVGLLSGNGPEARRGLLSIRDPGISCRGGGERTANGRALTGSAVDLEKGADAGRALAHAHQAVRVDTAALAQLESPTVVGDLEQQRACRRNSSGGSHCLHRHVAPHW